MSRFGDYLREGAADIFGFREQVEKAEEMEELLEGIGSDAKLLARKVEDAEYNLLNGDTDRTYKEQGPKSREKATERAYLYYHSDPVVGQAVNLVTWYTFGRGVPKPKYRLPPEQDGINNPGQSVIDAFWFDEDNQRTLTTHQAQEAKSTELQLQGNIFLLLFPDGEVKPPPAPRERSRTMDLRTRRDDEGEQLRPLPQTMYDSEGRPRPQQQSPLKVTDVPASEITEIITHPDNRKIPLFYKRTFKTREYDFKSGAWKDTKTHTVYYKDWKHEAPQGFGPKPEQLAPGLIYHVAVNKTSDEKFGRSELSRVLDWAKGLNAYMTSRMQVVQAIAQIALKVKTRGGAKGVNQIAADLRDISSLANQIEGGAMRRERAADGKTKIAIENQGAELQPMVQDSGASGAATDIQTMLGQVAAGTGIPAHYFGSAGGASLATATAMELPVLKQMEARQELWESVYRDLTAFAVTQAGLDPEQVEVTMPGILARDSGAVAQTLLSIATSVPMIGDANVVRFVFSEVLDAMGKVNAEEIVARLFPEGWEPPTMAPPGAEASGGPAMPATGGAERQGLPAANAATATAARNGADRAPSDRGGTAASRQAAQARQDRASGRVGGRQTYTEALSEAAASKDREILAKMPEEVRDPAEQALKALEELEREVMAGLDGDAPAS